MGFGDADAGFACEDCDRPATVHVAERHWCRECAAKRELIAKPKKLDLPMVVKEFAMSTAVAPASVAQQCCPDCGTAFMEFRKLGRLGCPFDYVVFRAGLVPIFDRVQRARRHVGKRPSHALAIESHPGTRRLRRELRDAIAAEDYERAARVRDAIRAKGAEHDP